MSVPTKPKADPALSGTGPHGRITRDDVKAQLQTLQGGVDKEVADKKKTVITAAAGTALVLIFLFFLLGKRAGRKKTTIVEIRRV